MRWRDLGVRNSADGTLDPVGVTSLVTTSMTTNSGCPSTTFCLDAIDHRAQVITTTTPASTESNVKTNVYRSVDP
jgi:hypothetical protein